MRIFQHGLKSIMRKKVKTLMLFSIFFVVFSLVFSGIVINNAVDDSKTYIREEVGAVVQYTINFNEWRQSDEASNTIPTVDFDIAYQLSESDYVDYMYTVQTTMWSSTELTGYANESTISFKGMGQGGGTGEDSTTDISSETFSVSAVSETETLNMINGDDTLIDGSLFTDTDMEEGNLVAYITSELAVENNLIVGDTFELNGEDFEIVGLYDTVNEEKNIIYIPNETYLNYNIDGEFAMFIGEVYYFLNSVDDIEAFKAESEEYLPSEYHMLDSNDKEVEELSAPLDLVSVITSIITYVVFIAGALIVIAIVTIFIRDRKFEIGLLLASGEKRSNIVLQFIIEVMVISLIGFAFSVASSFFVADIAAEWIVNNGVLETATATEASIQISQRNISGTTSVFGTVTSADVANDFNPNVGLNSIVNMLGVSVLLVVISSMVPLIGIMNYKPRKILQD